MGFIDPDKVPLRTGSRYPEPYASEMQGRASLRFGDAGGLTQFGANLVILQPGAKSSLRHWHRNEDEFVVVMLGECTLVQDAGETVLHQGDCAAFKAGDPDGHQFINKTAAEARFLVVGSKSKCEVATYSDVDLIQSIDYENETAPVFTYKDGTPWSGPR